MIAVEKLYKILIKEMLLVESKLTNNIPVNIKLLQDVYKYICNAGGKRLRPLLTIAIGKITSEIKQEHILLAAAVELIHTATLLHDDVIDSSKTRRNIPTVNSIWDNKTSILVGDNMFSKAFQFMIDTNKMTALKELADVSATISAAEVWQLQILNKIDITVDEYIRLITNKTAVFFAAACSVGAIASNCDEETINNARNFGLNFGICYQIADDWFDYNSNSKKIGKEIFQDIREGKVTIPLIFLLKKLHKNNQTDALMYISNILGKDHIDYSRISELLVHYEIAQDITNFSLQYSNVALQYISKFPKNQISNVLSELVLSFLY